MPVPEAEIWPVFYAEAVESHRATYPARAEEYGPVIRAKLEVAQRTQPQAVAAGYGALERWRRAAVSEPAVDVIVSPVLGVAELPAIDTHEEEFRIAFSAYTRVFSFLGWPAIALGEVQLAARDMRTLLEAALAWPGAE